MEVLFGNRPFQSAEEERWLCHLYGTILVYLISQLIAYQLRNFIWEEKQIEISEMVAMRSIATEVLPKLYEMSIKKEKAFKDLVQATIRLLLKTAWRPKSSKGTAFKHLQFIWNPNITILSKVVYLVFLKILVPFFKKMKHTILLEKINK